MAVYVDNVQVAWRGKRWCHLVADTLSELHAFAKQLELRRAWFQHSASYPHYDVTLETRVRALALGAQAGTRVQIITCARKLKLELAHVLVVSAPEQLALFHQVSPPALEKTESWPLLLAEI